jgi:hypothetical protein
MKRSHHVTRTLVLWTLLGSLAAASAGATTAAQPAPSDPLRIVPADVMYVVQINRFFPTLAQIDQFLTGISPVGPSMPVRAQLAQILGQPEPVGLNLEGNVALFGPLPGGEKPEPKRVGVLVPLSNFQQFLTNPNVAKPNAQGIVQIGPAGKPMLAGIQLGNYLLVTRIEDQQALTEAKSWTTGGTGSLAQRLGPEESQRSSTSPIWAYANIQVIGKLYGPELQEKLQEAQKKLQEMQATGQPIPGAPKEVMVVWASLVNSFLQEVQSVSLVLNPSPSVLRISPEIGAMPNSELAKALNAPSPTPAPNLTGYMENGTITTAVARLNPVLVRLATLKRVELFTALMGPSVPKETVDEMRKLALNAADALGSDAALAFLPALKSKPPFVLRYVATVRDKQKLNDVLDESAKLASQSLFQDLVQKFGLKMEYTLKRNAETYKGVPIDAIHIGIQSLEPNSPQGRMIQAAYGSGLDLRLAVVNNLLLYVLSATPQQDIQALIDKAQSGAPGQTPSEVQTALELIPNAMKANIFGIYNYVRAIQMVMAFVPMPLPPVEMPAHGDIPFTADLGNSRILVNVAVPKQHVLEVKEALGRLRQQMQPQPQPGQPGAQPPTTPGKPPTKPAQPPAGKPGQT